MSLHQLQPHELKSTLVVHKLSSHCPHIFLVAPAKQKGCTLFGGSKHCDLPRHMFVVPQNKVIKLTMTATTRSEAINNTMCCLVNDVHTNHTDIELRLLNNQLAYLLEQTCNII